MRLINWNKAINPIVFIVNLTEVIFFRDIENTVWCFIGFPEKEVVVEHTRCSTEEAAKDSVSTINISDARDYYYREKKRLI